MNFPSNNSANLTDEEKDLVFELWDSFYTDGSDALKEWFQKEDEFLLKNIKKDCTLLDVGFGSGRHLRKLSSVAKMVFGIDKSSSFYQGFIQATDKYKNIRIFHESAQSTHFENDFFDYIICMDNTFGNFGLERNSIIKEFKRILKPSGKIFISVFSEHALDERIKEYKRIGLPIKSIDQETGYILSEDNVVLEQFSRENLQDIFATHGFETEIHEETPISYMCTISSKG